RAGGARATRNGGGSAVAAGSGEVEGCGARVYSIRMRWIRRLRPCMLRLEILGQMIVREDKADSSVAVAFAPAALGMTTKIGRFLAGAVTSGPVPEIAPCGHPGIQRQAHGYEYFASEMMVGQSMVGQFLEQRAVAESPCQGH